MWLWLFRIFGALFDAGEAEQKRKIEAGRERLRRELEEKERRGEN